MLMPGRYLSDTTARCQTITQTRFFTTYVDSCWTVPGWPLWNPWVIRIGNATVTPAGTAIQAVLPDPSSMFYISRTAVPSAINHVSLLVESVSNPVVISVIETVDGQEVVLGEQLLQAAQMSTVSFSITPSTPSIRIRVRWFTAPAILRWRTICVQVPQMQSETYLVDVCDEIGDQYRFGFNGMHKDNEMQGIGNSLDFGARIYDSRLGRFLSLDPLSAKFPSESNFIFAGNSPIVLIDQDGRFKIPIHKQITLYALMNAKFVPSYTARLDIVTGNTVKSDVLGAMKDLHFDGRKNYSEISESWKNLNIAINDLSNDFGWGNRSLGGPDANKLGVLLHTAQDFYAHSNYIELYIDYFKSSNNGNIPKASNIPIFSEGVSNEKFLNTYLIPNLKSGEFHLGDYLQGKDVKKTNKGGNIHHDQIAKDNTDMGQEVYSTDGKSSINTYDAAVKTAEKESLRVVNQIITEK